MKQFEQEAQDTGRRRLILSVAVGVSEKQITHSYNVPEMMRDVDFINIMGYDFHGPWDKFTGGNSPLFSRYHDRQFNVHNSLVSLTKDFSMNNKTLMYMGPVEFSLGQSGWFALAHIVMSCEC